MENEEELEDQTEVAKFMIDEEADFRLSAAYETYSRIWETDPPQEVKKELNRAISQLSDKEIDYDTFYFTINEYRQEAFSSTRRRGGRGRIQTQRKRDWRAKEARKRKNSRYKR